MTVAVRQTGSHPQARTGTGLAERGTHRGTAFRAADLAALCGLTEWRAAEFLSDFEQAGVVERISPTGFVLTPHGRRLGEDLSRWIGVGGDEPI